VAAAGVLLFALDEPLPHRVPHIASKYPGNFVELGFGGRGVEGCIP